jgi:type II secretory pathway predicted ATPase ExeA
MLQEYTAESAAGAHPHVVQRLSRIERTVETIQNALMEAAEMGESRHEDLVRQLHDISDEVGHNQKLLRELRRQGCVRKQTCFFVMLLVTVCGWLYIVRTFM